MFTISIKLWSHLAFLFRRSALFLKIFQQIFKLFQYWRIFIFLSSMITFQNYVYDQSSCKNIISRWYWWISFVIYMLSMHQRMLFSEDCFLFAFIGGWSIMNSDEGGPAFMWLCLWLLAYIFLVRRHGAWLELQLLYLELLPAAGFLGPSFSKWFPLF